MTRLLNCEYGLEIDKTSEESIMNIDNHYMGGLITQEEMATTVANIIYNYLKHNEIVLIKILKG
jgi:hypothetical protein